MRTGPRIAGRAPSPTAGPARAPGPAAPVVAKTRLRLPAPRSVRTGMAATAATRTTEGEPRTAGEEARTAGEEAKTAEGKARTAEEEPRAAGEEARTAEGEPRTAGEEARTAGDTRRCCGSEVSALAWLELKEKREGAVRDCGG